MNEKVLKSKKFNDDCNRCKRLLKKKFKEDCKEAKRLADLLGNQ